MQNVFMGSGDMEIRMSLDVCGDRLDKTVMIPCGEDSDITARRLLEAFTALRDASAPCSGQRVDTKWNSSADAEWNELKAELGVETEPIRVGWERLVDMRKRLKLTKLQVGEVMGVTKGRVAHLEKGGLATCGITRLTDYVQAIERLGVR